MVAQWVDWSDSQAALEWDAYLRRQPSYNLYQSHAWGEFKRASGWTVRRGGVVVDGVQRAIAQCLIREIRPARMVVVWVPGGPAGTIEGRRQLAGALRQSYGSRRLFFYVRMNLLERDQPENRAALLSGGWHPASQSISQRETFQVDLEPAEPIREERLSQNWRHNLRRGEQRGVAIRVWDHSRPLDEPYAVYRDMCQLQRIPPAMSLADLDRLRSAFGDNFTLAVASTNGDGLCAMRAFARIGAHAQDMIAGVSLAGRRLYANFPLTWRVLTIAREQGAKVYDLAGVDWVAAEGVSNFKKGLGGELITLAGEWEWASAPWLRWGMNVALRVRRVSL